MNEPIAGTFLKLTSESGKAIRALPARGRALVKRVPPPVQIELARLSSRGAHVCREIFAGILVVGLIAIVGGYGRLARGPISLPSLVPPIETAINDQLTDLHVKIDDAVLQRSADGPGVLFRLRNIRLIDKDGSIVAQAPLAAIGMSGSALLSGRLAPGSVDFIGPRLLLSHNSDQGLALSFTRPSGEDGDSLMRGTLPAGEAADQLEVAPESVVTKRLEPPVGAGPRKFDLNKTVAEVFDRARAGDTSYLTRFGFKNAIVVLNQDGEQTLWQVPDFAIDLEHRDNRSILVGQANVASSKGDWQLEVRTEEHTRRDSLSITALIENLVPSGIAGNFPSIGVLRALDMAVDGDGTVELSNSGDFLSGEAKLRLAPGHITPPWDRDMPMRIDHGDFTVRYHKHNDVVEIAPSTLRWGKSKATISGEFRPVRDAKNKPVSWDFDLKAENAVFAIEEFGLGPTNVDEWRAMGNIAPKDGRLTLSRFVIRAGGASIVVSGTVVDAPGSPEINLAGDVSAMPVDTLKQLWPKFLAGKARKWVLARIAGGEVLGGKFNVALPAGALAEIEKGGDAPDGAISVELNLSGMSIAYIPKMPPVITGDAKLTVVGTEFVVDIPQARIVVASGEEVALSEGRFFIPDLREDPQQGVITFRAAAATPTVMQLLDHEPLGYIREVGMKSDFLGGTAEGEFTLSMPLKAELDFKEIKMQGMARLNDAIASNIVGDMGIEGGALGVDLSDAGVTARGEIKIKDVPAEINWQRVFYTPDDQQPPVQVSATLDEALREQLGIKVNHLVQGPTTLTLSVAGLGKSTQAMSMEADLTDAQLVFGGMGWTKPKGQAARIAFDVVKNEDGSTDLKNLRIVGDDIAVYGEIAIDAEQHLKGFHFSDFSVNQFTHVEITASVRDDQVLEIHAEGPTYDGKQFFRSLFSAGQLVEDGSDEPSDPFGIDLTAKIGQVSGFYDTTATDVEVLVKKRNGQLVALDAKGALNGSAPLAVKLEESNGARLIKAEARDAGAAFKLVGFYRSIEGGLASLQVNLDAGGPGTKLGTLWAQDFDVVGDAVVADVLTDPSSTAVLGQQKQQIARSRIRFKQLRAPFSVGSGKFRLRDAYINGPALGATMRGTVDFKSQTVDLGGTYVPLYGLNSALGNIPILGRVLVGRQGEGVVGITFAIKGKLDDPSVLVNPMSVMTPGIFRQIFDFTGSIPPDAAAASASPEFEGVQPFGR
ncbi:MAG: AsmA-like C-terminal domain-containing protein [Methyloceanibacter sp.]|uniref:YhdP family protein n=1 Tax=Methyloceanibacter sp. TaxID=1965321 RepID=UPI003D6D8D09